MKHAPYTEAIRLAQISATHSALKIRFAAGPCAEVGEIVFVLTIIDEAYRGFCQWHQVIQNVDAGFGMNDERPMQIQNEQQLCIAVIETTAPAQIEVVGAQKPIDCLRIYLKQPRRTRANDLGELVAGDILHLRGHNIPDDQIRSVLGRYLIAPLTRLDAHPDVDLSDEDVAGT